MMNSKLPKNQLVAIVAIIVVGILLGTLILTKGSVTASKGEAEHAGHAPEKQGSPGDKHLAQGGETSGKEGHGNDAPGKQANAEQVHEDKVLLDDAQIKAAGIEIRSASAGAIVNAVTLPAEIRYNEDRTAHVVPRLAGVVESVQANLGQKVKKGQVLAVIASPALSEQRSELQAAQRRLALAKTTYERERMLWQEKIAAEQDYLQARHAMEDAEIAVRNLQQKLAAVGAAPSGAAGLNRYAIRAPFDGLVMEKHLSLGEAVKEDASIFTISDLSSVWAEVAVPPKDLASIRVGQQVDVKATAFDAQARGTVVYVGSLLGEQTRTAKANVALANPEMTWRPGLFVNVEIPSGQAEAKVAVPREAVHTIDDKPAVFVRVPGGFLAQAVTLGRSDGKTVEVLEGLKPGAQYAAAGSFILKSELGKAQAGHEH